METIRLTTAQALVRFLNVQYVYFNGQEHRFVEGIFTIFGHGNVLGLGQALEENPGHLKVYQGRNEQGMAHIAMAFAKQRNRKQILACTSSVGPGSANMVTAAATATANQIPLLLLPGDVFITRQPDPVLQQIEQTHNLSISTNDAFQAVSKYWDRITRPEQLISAMINAMRVLTNVEDTGAVVIALPQDVQGEAWDFPLSFFNKRVHIIERRTPNLSSIEAIATTIRQKEKPLLIIGGGVRYSEAGEEVLAFAKKYGIPFAETQAGKSTIPSSEKLNVGGIGVTGNLCANELAKQADVIIGLGTRFTDFTTASKSLFANKEVITINASPFHAQKLDAQYVIADVKEGIKALDNALIGYSANFSELEELKTNWQIERNRLAKIVYNENFTPEVSGHLDNELKDYVDALQTKLTQTTALLRINELIEHDAIITGAAGSLPGDLQRLWESETANTYHMEYGYSCMGYEISAALGAKIASPKQEVYAMVGDGSFLMLHSELVTSLQENKKINILLFDNAGFGCINNLQMSNGMGSFKTEFRYRDEQTSETNGPVMAIDYAKVGEGYGLKTYRITSILELDAALKDAKSSPISTLLDIKVLPKTMTDGYGAWWHVGVAETSNNPNVQLAFKNKEQNLQTARKY
ncbi:MULTISPECIES: 3D-(3,5/4)-trihydroxycyclohexane-1,2-dione acylhydrolase (decyclizing) [unclassified Lysinibacillus]|uniref:3D-(3,5/4)-trihydroxycyclohexane-1,2-dione acylhydrolase (decyclizing) n=1 Tax=unclassified Lysinibacillus TaxID=2636778 RepID=UPI0038223015